MKLGRSIFFFFNAMVKESPTSLTAKGRALKATNKKHTQTTVAYTSIEKSDYNNNLEFNLILDLSTECEVAKTVSRGKMFHNGTTLGKKETE